MQVSIRELKSNPSHYIHQAELGHAVWLTSHKRVVGRIIAVMPLVGRERLGDIPNVQWSGRKPSMMHPRVTLRGASLADTVLEMR